MNQRNIWAVGAIAFGIMGFVFLVSPITEVCGDAASPLKLFDLVGEVALTCRNGAPVDALLSSAQLAVGGPFVASGICLILSFMLGRKKDSKESDAKLD